MRCERLGDRLAASVHDDGAALDESSRHHVEHCLRCQVELVRGRRLARSLQALRADVVVPDADLLPAILDAVARDDDPCPRPVGRAGRRAAYLGGIAAATAAGAAGVLVLATRSRRLAG